MVLKQKITQLLLSLRVHERSWNPKVRFIKIPTFGWGSAKEFKILRKGEFLISFPISNWGKVNRIPGNPLQFIFFDKFTPHFGNN